MPEKHPSEKDLYPEIIKVLRAMPSLHVLAADDEPAIRSIIAVLLREIGFSPTCVPDGEIGLAEFHRQRPDLIITDIDMPGMNGFQLIAEVRKSAAFHIPIVAMSSGYGRVKCLEAQADEFLAKPVTAERLYAVLHRMFI